MTLHHIRLLTALTLAACVWRAPARPQVMAAIGGQVFNGATEQPLTGATVVLTTAAGASQPKRFVTQTRGVFLFENLQPGRYLLFAECPGFARTAYGSRGNPLAGISLSLAEGQQMNDLAFELTPGSSIAGKVMEAGGEAAIGSMVFALQPIYQRGKKEYVPLASAAADALGEYKLQDLSAGTYLLAAVERGGGLPAYYPGAASAVNAEPVTVAAAGSATGKDLQLAPISGHRVSGTLSGAVAAIAWLTPKGGATSLIGRMAASVGPDGGFEFANVAPGAYILSATQLDGVTTAAAPIPLTMAQKDVADVALKAQASGELNGEAPGAVQIVLEPADAPLPRPPRAPVDENGKFHFENLAPERYLVHVLAPETFYTRSLRYRGEDAMETPIEFSPSVAAPLLIGLSSNGASVGGTVRGPDGEPMPGAVVALVPTPRRFSRYKETTTDQFGEYRFHGIAPGNYQVFAWSHIDSGAYQDAAWLKKYEAKGHPFTAKPGASEGLALKAIE